MREKTRKTARIGVLGALGFMLLWLEFAILPAAPFLKLSFADVPALLASFAMGPVAGVCTVLVTNILHMCLSSSGFIGELANFLISGIYVVAAGLIYKRIHTKSGAATALTAGGIIMTLAASVINRFLLLPLYMPDVGAEFLNNTVLTAILPFNLIKAAVLFLILMLLYKPLSPILKGQGVDKL